MNNYKVYDDKLIRFVPVKGYGENFTKADLVITKEEFLSCYNAWVLGNAWELGREVQGEK